WAAGSDDRLSACLPAGTYYLRAFSFFAGQNRYSVSWSASPGVCAEEDDWWSTCWDDGGEEDDGAGGARWVDLDQPVHRDDGNQICSGDDDWYQLYLYDGEVLRATLAFDLTGPGQDLDFHVLDESGTDLTPCSVEEPSECSENGQSSGPGEEIEFTAAAEGTYYLVVRGWAGAENAYDLCASLSETACP
ncbi:MAG TPA: PPC domain-containing protein, partial [Kofleriaceae bacterium]|nr:PPC domain-containing protein [Kofleriaceae bacterium]